MTTASRPTKTRWWRLLVAAVVAVLATLIGAGTASATSRAVAETRVGAFSSAAGVLVGPIAHVSPVQGRAGGVPQGQFVVATGVAAETGSATVSRVTANKIAGDAFRDQVAGRLESEGFNIVGTEVSVKTPLGRRVIDILAERNGGLVNFETKLGGSRYLPSQRAKDWWISNGGVDVLGNGSRTTFPTVVIRGPLP